MDRGATLIRNIKPDDQPLCAEYDPEMWFPEPHSKENPLGSKAHQEKAILEAVEAMKICQRCPLQLACVEYAMESLETVHYGIYGGSLPIDRQKAIGSGDVSSSETWQVKIRRMADQAGVIPPYIAKRERPTLLVSLKERASWQQGWDLSSPQDSF